MVLSSLELTIFIFAFNAISEGAGSPMGSPLQRFPPIVPQFLVCTEATLFSISERTVYLFLDEGRFLDGPMGG